MSFSNPAMKIVGLILFIIGFIIWYTIGRRRFYRRTMTGAEVFKSYESAWFTRIVERVLKMIALFLMLGGASVFVLSYE